jgi:hypothetical protein
MKFGVHNQETIDPKHKKNYWFHNSNILISSPTCEHNNSFYVYPIKDVFILYENLIEIYTTSMNSNKKRKRK